MNTPASISAAVLSLCLISPLCARVGETQADVERRMLQPNLGKTFFRSKPDDPREERERAKEEREQPFYEVKKFFPAEKKEGIYWKSAMSTHLSPDNGWKVHVFYIGGRSTLEAYRRVGESLNEFEVRALLGMNRGGSSWKRVERKEGEGRGGETGGIGYDFELEDGSMRAKQKGDWLMIFSTRLDTYVVEQQKLAKELRDKENEKLKQEQQAKAPESVMGF